MSEVVLSKLAEADLLDIWGFIARDNVEAADRLVEQIHEKCRFLANMPKIGRQRPDIDPSIRSFTVGIQVARVLHGSRNIPSLFR